MHLPVDAQSPIRPQLTEPRKHVIEGGSVPRNQPCRAPGSWPAFSTSIRIRSGAPSRISSGVGTGPSPPDGCGPSRGCPGPRAPRGRHWVVRRASVNVSGRPAG
jgi:hypothetical protein